MRYGPTNPGLACSGTRLTPAGLQERSRYDGAGAISKCLYAVAEVFEVAGRSVMHLSNPIQRFLRALLAMRNHPIGALEANAVPYVRSVLNHPQEEAK